MPKRLPPVELDRGVGQLRQAKRDGDLEGHERRVDHFLRQCLRQRGHRHCDRLSAQFLDHPCAGARGAADLQAGEVLGAFDGAACEVQRVACVNVNEDRVDVLEVLGEVFHHVVDGEVRRAGVSTMHIGKLKHFEMREAARGVSRQGPGQIDHTVTHLAVELGRRAAKRHGRENLEVDASAGRFLDGLCPGLKQHGLSRRFWAQEVVDRELELLREGGRGNGNSAERRGQPEHAATGDGHGRSSLDGTRQNNLFDLARNERDAQKLAFFDHVQITSVA